MSKVSTFRLPPSFRATTRRTHKSQGFSLRREAWRTAFYEMQSERFQLNRDEFGQRPKPPSKLRRYLRMAG